MITYKLFRVKKNKLYPLYVFANEEVKTGEWLDAKVGELADSTHVKSKLGALSLRPGWHSTMLPWTDWIGKRDSDGKLMRRQDSVWCECEVEGEEIKVTSRYGLRELPAGYYYFKTNSKQKDPWIISNKIKVNRILTESEVNEICLRNNVEPQKIA